MIEKGEWLFSFIDLTSTFRAFLFVFDTDEKDAYEIAEHGRIEILKKREQKMPDIGTGVFFVEVDAFIDDDKTADADIRKIQKALKTDRLLVITTKDSDIVKAINDIKKARNLI